VGSGVASGHVLAHDPEHHMDASQPMPAPPGANNEHGMLSTISNEMVRIYKGQFGRGPTKTRTQWAGPDVLVVTLEKTLTPAEHSLCRLGEHGRLRDLRLLFQYAELTLFCEPIERATGRKVRAFISGIDSVADIATEMFVLHPVGYDGLSRTAAGIDDRPAGISI
jgi:uncharacterized protein YbcI